MIILRLYFAPITYDTAMITIIQCVRARIAAKHCRAAWKLSNGISLHQFLVHYNSKE